MSVSKKQALLCVGGYVSALLCQALLMHFLSSRLSINLLENIPDLSFLNTQKHIYDYFEAVHKTGRLYYIYSAIYDSFYVLIYCSVGGVVWKFFVQSQQPLKVFFVAPVALGAAGLCDLMENICYGVIAYDFPAAPDYFYSSGIMCTTMKLILLLLYVLSLALIIIVWFKKSER